jgi:ferrous iron transport protein B
MHEAVIHLHPAGALVALVGLPNCGKTALFNRLTGSRQKVANYAGATVERKEGRFTTPGGRRLRVLDLPGTYSLYPRTADERVTCGVLQGRAIGEKRPDLVVCVADATRMARSLRLVLAVRRLGLPCVVALSMSDVAQRRGCPVDAPALSRELGVPVVATVGVQSGGDDALRRLLDDAGTWHNARDPAELEDASGDAARVRGMLQRLGLEALPADPWSERLDRLVLHRWGGPLLLMGLLFLIFQAMFVGAQAPMGWIEAAVGAVGGVVAEHLPEHPLRSLLVDGVIAGVGGVLVFLPQILILFFFLLVLEESGYLPRAAFVLDRLLDGAGLSGRAFIPLLSSFACAVPALMATRTMADARERWVTMLVAPLMTCSARLPVYAVLIAAFIPQRRLAAGMELQGLVLFGLYGAGVASAWGLAWGLKRYTRAGREPRVLMMELPDYHWPTFSHLALGLWQRAWVFLRRVGGIILPMSIALWALSSWPLPPEGAGGSAIEHSLAGQLGHALAWIFEPLGFGWQVSVSLLPAMAAREAIVASLATVYAVGGIETEAALSAVLASQWSLASGLALLAWFVFAPHCLATLAAARRETGSWRLTITMLGIYFGLAWAAAWITYRTAAALGGG